MHILTFKKPVSERSLSKEKHEPRIGLGAHSADKPSKFACVNTTVTLAYRPPVDTHTRRLMYSACGPMIARRRVPATPATLPNTAGLARTLEGPTTTTTRITGRRGSLGPGTLFRAPRRRQARMRSALLVDGGS